ncbi:sigma-70 family RNA polymerase sigma factor [Isosphaeraceae bacterium EP7]
MVSSSGGQASREFRTLFAVGAVGGLTDSQLIDRFVARDGIDREDAFGALVQRHGPMVLGVCRRMLLHSTDADDAFQAVFLILARKAPSLRSPDALKPWLYGVAVRTSREARRHSSRRRDMEGGTFDATNIPSTTATDPNHADLLALLDEELTRLPARYRTPLMLCDLEGTSRQDAARQLNLPEGTLSSRLSRGRTLLRDRLIRRGITTPAGLLPLPASLPALAPSLADSTVRLALTFASGGAVTAAIAALAQRILKTMIVANFKLMLGTALVLAAATCLTITLAARPAPGPSKLPTEPPPLVVKAGKIAPPKPEPAEPRPAEVTPVEPTNREPIVIRGHVVDEAGKPAVGVTVRSEAFDHLETLTVTAADGSFSLPIRRRQVDNLTLLAVSSDGWMVGLFNYTNRPTLAAIEAPPRIILKPAVNVAVRVFDNFKAPIAGATVQAYGNGIVSDGTTGPTSILSPYGPGIISDGTTGPNGTVMLHIPADSSVHVIYALKAGQGFDFTTSRSMLGLGLATVLLGTKAADFPSTTDLTLDSPRTLKIKAVDRDNKPLAGVRLAPNEIRKKGKSPEIRISSRSLGATTGPDGIATFDWLPQTDHYIVIYPRQEGYSRRQIIVKPGDSGPIVAALARNETIRGRVTRPDGTPAKGILIVAAGSGWGNTEGRDQVRTGTDGTYELQLNPGEAYHVGVDDPEFSASTRMDVVLRVGVPVAPVDFKLSSGTIVRGRLTIDPDGRPVTDGSVVLQEWNDLPAGGLQNRGSTNNFRVSRTYGANTDTQGRYSIRVGPGKYVFGFAPPAGQSNSTGTGSNSNLLSIKDEPEIVRDFRLPRPGSGSLAGKVVAGPEGRGVAGAVVEILDASERGGDRAKVVADAEGRFVAYRRLNRTFLHARSPDGALAAIVEFDIEGPDFSVRLAPTAQATGLLLDEQGKPASNQQLTWGRRIALDDAYDFSTLAFVPKVETDADGRFTLPNLVVGQEYEVLMTRDGATWLASIYRPESPGPHDLGAIRAGSVRRQAPPNTGVRSAFDKDIPPADAQPIPFSASTLDDKYFSLNEVRGKNVLLAFWATWSNRSLVDLPRLKALHDAHAKDPRFAIIGVNVGSSLEDLNAFLQTHTLPWTQVNIGGSLHGQATSFGIRALPAYILIGPDGHIIARGSRADDLKDEVAKALAKSP